MKFGLIFIISIFLIDKMTAQDLPLSVEDAVGIALKNNYDIQVARNDAEIAKINNSLGNAGMLPGIDIVASDNYSLNTVHQKVSSGNPAGNVNTNSLNGGIELNWTLFDGGHMFITKNKLNEIQNLGEIQFRQKVLQTEYDVIIAYYDVVRQKQQLVSINEVINSNLERVNILKTSFEAGLSAKTNLLQAQIDLNVFKENSINQEAAIIASKRNLNMLLSRDTNIVFEVPDSIPLNYKPDKKDLIQKLYSVNTSVLYNQKQVDIAKLSLKEFKTQLLPRLSVNAGYNFLNTNNSSGMVLINKVYGPQTGASITIPLYQSGNVHRQIQSAELQLQSTQLKLESIKIQINTDLLNTFTDYENQLQLLEIEKYNSSLAKENLEISMQRLKLGQTTSLELHQAQESFVDSHTRLINFEYNLKVAETKLRELLSAF